MQPALRILCGGNSRPQGRAVRPFNVRVTTVSLGASVHPGSRDCAVPLAAGPDGRGRLAVSDALAHLYLSKQVASGLSRCDYTQARMATGEN